MVEIMKIKEQKHNSKNVTFCAILYCITYKNIKQKIETNKGKPKNHVRAMTAIFHYDKKL